MVLWWTGHSGAMECGGQWQSNGGVHAENLEKRNNVRAEVLGRR